MIQANDHSLLISDVNDLDSGEYTCIAKTRLDEASASATLEVQPNKNIPETTSIIRELKKYGLFFCMVCKQYNLSSLLSSVISTFTNIIVIFVHPATVPPPITAIDSLKIIPLGSCAFLLVLSNMPLTTKMFLSSRIQYQVIHGTDKGELREGHIEIYSHNPTQAKLSGLKPNTNYRIFIGIKTTPNERNELIFPENRYFYLKKKKKHRYLDAKRN